MSIPYLAKAVAYPVAKHRFTKNIGVPKIGYLDICWCVLPCVAKAYAVCPVFCTGGRGARGSRSKNLLEGAMKQLVQGSKLELLDEAQAKGHWQHPGPESRTFGTCLINPGGFWLI